MRVLRALMIALPIGMGFFISISMKVSAGELFLCEKNTTEIFPKVINCLGTDYYVSHQAIGLTAAMLLEHRCGSNRSAEGYQACRDTLLREVIAAYQRLASNPR